VTIIRPETIVPVASDGLSTVLALGSRALRAVGRIYQGRSDGLIREMSLANGYGERPASMVNC